jgi:hypothetical protein
MSEGIIDRVVDDGAALMRDGLRWRRFAAQLEPGHRARLEQMIDEMMALEDRPMVIRCAVCGCEPGPAEAACLTCNHSRDWRVERP